MGQSLGKPKQGCMSRVLGRCGEKSLINRYMGREQDSQMEFDTQMTYKQLSFSDFDEDRSNLLNNQTEGGLEFSDDESV